MLFNFIVGASNLMKVQKSNIRNSKPWPLKDTMQQVYENKLWGGSDSDFYSGEGSHNPEITEPYLNALKTFLNSLDNPITICDLGCGDFNVGKELVKHTKKYVGVDIVPTLIERNKAKYKDENLSFECLDIASDELPIADCALIRQVLQHLSNYEVELIVTKLHKYRYVIVAEHLPVGDFTPNKDIISGQGIRLKKQSGVDLLAPPFNFSVKETHRLASSVLKNNQGIIETVLYVTFATNMPISGLNNIQECSAL